MRVYVMDIDQQTTKLQWFVDQQVSEALFEVGRKLEDNYVDSVFLHYRYNNGRLSFVGVNRTRDHGAANLFIPVLLAAGKNIALSDAVVIVHWDIVPENCDRYFIPNYKEDILTVGMRAMLRHRDSDEYSEPSIKRSYLVAARNYTNCHQDFTSLNGSLKDEEKGKYSTVTVKLVAVSCVPADSSAPKPKSPDNAMTFSEAFDYIERHRESIIAMVDVPNIGYMCVGEGNETQYVMMARAGETAKWMTCSRDLFPKLSYSLLHSLWHLVADVALIDYCEVLKELHRRPKSRWRRLGFTSQHAVVSHEPGDCVIDPKKVSVEDIFDSNGNLHTDWFDAT